MDERTDEISRLRRELATLRERDLPLQYAVGRALAGAPSLDVSARSILEIIAGQLGYRAALLWTVAEDEQVLRCTAQWEKSSEKDGFATICKEMTFASGTGLPGRVWNAKAPVWMADLQDDEHFGRLPLAAEHGLRSAFAFPILLRGKVEGVIEFFADAVRPADEEILSIAAAIGYQIGEFLERVRAQQQLADREESYRVLAETASDGIITINETSTILFANGAAARMFGYVADELIGNSMTILMPEALRSFHLEGIARFLEAGEKHLTWQSQSLTGQHRAGYEFPIEVSFGQYKRNGKQIFVGTLRDVTERMRVDESLRQSAKLESLGVLAGGIAHDFNNLLTGILGNVSLALEIIDESHPATQNLRDAIEASEKAANLTKQMLAYAGKGRYLIEPIDLSALVREMSALIRSSVPRHVTLRLDLQQPLPQVDADVAQLQQLIMNLVINAAEAIPESRQGTVLVMTRSQEVNAEYLASLDAIDAFPGNYVSMSVHDNGVGIDDSTLDKIFDPFFTTKFTGRGLGLAATLGIVRGHKGILKVFSIPGQGTTFRMLLPASATLSKELPQSVVLARPIGQGTILVVDDELIVRKLATSSLERYGYGVVVAEDGREGLERFRKLHPQLKMVLLDMTMPTMSGEETLEKMQLINAQVPIVMSSGYNEVEAIRRFTGKGIAGFLQKPYTPATLGERVRKILLEAEDRAARNQSKRFELPNN